MLCCVVALCCVVLCCVVLCCVVLCCVVLCSVVMCFCVVLLRYVALLCRCDLKTKHVESTIKELFHPALIRESTSVLTK